MIRAACSILIKELFKAGKIDQERKQRCLEFIMEEENHKKIRNLIAMVLLPKTLHKNDQSQTAYLRAAVSRVSQKLSFIVVLVLTFFGIPKVVFSGTCLTVRRKIEFNQ